MQRHVMGFWTVMMEVTRIIAIRGNVYVSPNKLIEIMIRFIFNIYYCCWDYCNYNDIQTLTHNGICIYIWLLIKSCITDFIKFDFLIFAKQKTVAEFRTVADITMTAWRYPITANCCEPKFTLCLFLQLQKNQEQQQMSVVLLQQRFVLSLQWIFCPFSKFTSVRDKIRIRS